MVQYFFECTGIPLPSVSFSQYGLRSLFSGPLSWPRPGPGTNKDRNLTLHHGAVSWQRVKEDWLPPSNCLPSSRVAAAGWRERRMCPVCLTSIEWHIGMESKELRSYQTRYSCCHM